MGLSEKYGVKAVFQTYEEKDYQQVCDFFVELNRQGEMYDNWNWARWEWMYFHPYFVREHMGSIGVWKAGEKIVGIAFYDLFYGEAFCAALAEYQTLMPEIIAYAVHTFPDENGLGIAVHDKNEEMKALLQNVGFQRAEQTETVLRVSLKEKRAYRLPEKMRIREIHFPEDNMAYQTVIWKGFDHEDDPQELDKMLGNSSNLPIHRKAFLCLAAADQKGEFLAHCTCWYDERTNYAYVEPVCTIPERRGQGIGSAVVSEALNRCRALGAERAIVLSDLDFYKKMGFEIASHYTFYWIKES